MIPHIETCTFDKILTYYGNVKFNQFDYIENIGQPYFYLGEELKNNDFMTMINYKTISYNNIILYIQVIKRYCYYFSHIVKIDKTLFYYIDEIYNFLKKSPIKCDIKFLIQINLLSLLLKGNDGEVYISHLNILSLSLNEYINSIKEKIKLQ